MNRFGITLIVIIGILFAVPSNVNAVTDQNLEWNVQEGDEFYFKLYANGTSTIDEEIYFEIENTPPIIPDSIEEWSELPYCELGIYFANGTDLGMTVLIFLGLVSTGGAISLPVGNFELLEELLAPELIGETFINNAMIWGVSVVMDSSATEEIVVTANYAKADGFLATYQLMMYNKTVPGQYDLVSEMSVIRDDDNPIVVGPPDMEFYVDDINEDLTWDVSDANPAAYEIKLNGSVVESGEWTQEISHFTVSLEGLDVGYYVYSIVVSDVRNNIATDTVRVTILETPVVVDDTQPTDAGLFGLSWQSLLVTFGSISVIVIVVLLGFRSRKNQ